ncbi:hypothetical protein O159_20390 [Leifsonia xyli subsp. cynodontis DSM 46306]|uniref:DUF2993 domain-containing protein n=1 Tax=Leifsonia xyli subsp. cynodontis DSM 46306 TaxID=1389489 RepID=U3PBC1_LEIXC|nr:DUF2993 domain-containing protein [Leifsonia xyli]AGW42032.1 hypothetical protein O159_20390 [Leifsonia xyli subsp. cynodontis DSM 46306]
MTDQPTEQLLPGAAGDAPARASRRWPRLLVRTLVPLGVLAVLLVAADAIVRSVVEQRVAAEIEKSLPETVKADVDARIGGLSVLQQLLAGRFESVDLLAPRATVGGAPLNVRVHATGVPTELSKPIGSATGTLSISQDSLNKLVTVPGATGDLTLQQGAVGYDGRLDLLGLPVAYTVSANPEAAGKKVLLRPVKASISTGTGDVNVTRLLQSLTESGPFPVCAAQYLPDGVLVRDIAAMPGRATVVLSASRFVMGEEFLRSKGHCS